MVSISGVFSIFYGILLLSRIYAIANVYSFPVDATLIQEIYIGIIILLAVAKERKQKITKGITEQKVAIALLAGYLLLFGFVFVNPLMAQYTSGIVLRQGLFLAVVITTALFACRYNLLLEVIQTSFWTVGIVLCYQFITNLQDVAKIDVMTVFDVSTRSRVNFGLGHYNYLGLLCACEIVLGMWLSKLGHKQKASILVTILAAVMLLGSASRNAIFSLLIFVLMGFYYRLDKSSLRKAYKFLITLFVVFMVLLTVMFGDESISLESLLLASNRMVLFTEALPSFLESGRTWIGLGLASGEVYGYNLTPYKTYWIDNGYMYTLVASGYIGALMYLALIILFLRKFLHIKKSLYTIGALASATFLMYLFTALFEMTLFNGGVLINYIFMPIFLIILSYNRSGDLLFIAREKVEE